MEVFKRNNYNVGFETHYAIMNQQINILCACDENYAAYCGIMLTSLLEHNRGNYIVIYIFVSELSTKSIERFNSLKELFDCEINMIEPDKSVFDGCVMRDGDHVSLATYYRLVCGNILPEHVKKIIYLDCDVIVNTDLNELWCVDLGNNVCGGVTDAFYIEASGRLRIDTKYFNAGMLLIDVEAFRRLDVSGKCFKLLRDDPERIKFHDQDLLNIVVGDRVKRLPLRWNMLTAFLRTDHAEQYIAPEMEEEIAEEAVRPERLIIHYEYLPKPWQPWVMVRHPFYDLWHQVRRRSLWADAPLDRKVPFSRKLRIIALNIMWRLGIKRRPQYYII